jgi:hypothetical protein
MASQLTPLSSSFQPSLPCRRCPSLATLLDSGIGGVSIELHRARFADPEFLSSILSISQDCRWLKCYFGLGPVVVDQLRDWLFLGITNQQTSLPQVVGLSMREATKAIPSK